MVYAKISLKSVVKLMFHLKVLLILHAKISLLVVKVMFHLEILISYAKISLTHIAIYRNISYAQISLTQNKTGSRKFLRRARREAAEGTY